MMVLHWVCWVGIWWGQMSPPALPPDHTAEPSSESSITTELLTTMVSRLAQDANAEGEALLADGNILAAKESFEEAFQLAPSNPNIVHNLARTLFRIDDYPRAEKKYRRLLVLDPERPGLVEELADVVLRREAGPADLAELARLLQSQRHRSGAQPELILRQARVAARRQQLDIAERSYHELLAVRANDDLARLELGDLYRRFDREEDALRSYREVPTDSPYAGAAKERVWQLEVDRQARRFGWTDRSLAVSEHARSLLAQGLAFRRQGETALAEKALRQAVRRAPQFSRARVALGDLLQETGRRAAAETEYLRGLAFDQGNAELHRRLGELYLESGESGAATQAWMLLSRALQLRPDWSEIHLQLARAYQLSGDLPRARQAVQTYLAKNRSASEAKDARELLETLDRLLAESDSMTDEASPDAAMSSTADSRELTLQLNRARAHLARGETDAALAVIQNLTNHERGREVLNLAGQVWHALGKPAAAAESFAASLVIDPRQARVHAQLGVVRLQLGDTIGARQSLGRAAALGDLEAEFQLARLDGKQLGTGLVGVLRHPVATWSVRERLRQFVVRDRQSVFGPEARRMQERLDRSLLLGVAIVALVVLLLFGGAAAVRQWWWGGVDLGQFLSRYPEAGPEVQRLLSAIRHEVLKHNTSALAGVVSAMEAGEGAAERARYLGCGLLGSAQEAPVVDKFVHYTAELEQVARGYGVRLNLRHRDPAIRPIFVGLQRLQRVGRDLLRLDLISVRRRKVVLAQLRRASAALNQRAFAAIGTMLRQLRGLTIDEPMLTRCFERVRHEPAFSAVGARPLVIGDGAALPCDLRLPHHVLDDILTNLFRNAIESTIRSGATEVWVRLDVSMEINEITGHERVALAVCDRSSEPMSQEQLSRPSIEGGLGLVTQLVLDFDGTIGVEAGPASWHKAVVVRFHRAPSSDHGGRIEE